MHGIPADREEKDGTLQKIRKRHSWAVPEGASLGRQQTCGISPSRVRGHVQQSMGKHATVRWATGNAARWYASGARGAPQSTWRPSEGRQPHPRVSFPPHGGSVREGVLGGPGLCWVPPLFWGDGVIWGGAAAQSFLLSPSSWG